ncbi:MAG: division/cell wall cluster transcriptional repressor MraZ [Novosphingobium sp.]
MAGAQSQYRGQGFSPRGEKNRFVLPAGFRQTVRDASEGKRALCLDKHHNLPCLVGFGESYAAGFDEQIAHEEEIAIKRGEPFNRDVREAQLCGYDVVSFDESGRFVLPEYLGEQAGIADQLYFHGGIRKFTIWAPDVLFTMGPEWDSAKSSCRAKMAEHAGKGARK